LLKTFKYYFLYFKNILLHGIFSIISDKKKFRQFSALVNDFGISYNLSSRSEIIKVKELNEIVPDDVTDIIIRNLPWRQGNVTFYELFCISLIASVAKPGIVFEVGTFDGRTTLHLALNTPDKTVIHTIDLPPDNGDIASLKLDEGDPQLIYKKNFQTGYLFSGTDAGKKIIQHFSDSAKFDFSIYHGCADLFFIDGAHSYDYIKSDTTNALNTLCSKGIILWHDYGNIADVTDYLNQLSRQMSLVRIKNTSLVMYSGGK
jgi:hypothetical protein